MNVEKGYNKYFDIDPLNGDVTILNFINFHGCWRSGCTFVFYPEECWVDFRSFQHFVGFYLQIGYYGISFGVKSSKCYN